MDLIYDKFEANNEIDEYTTLSSLIDSVSDDAIDNYFIKYQDKPTSRFSFRKLVKIVYELYSGTQIRAKDLSEVIYKYDENSKGYKLANKDEISNLLSEMRKNLRMNSEFIEVIGREF